MRDTLHTYALACQTSNADKWGNIYKALIKDGRFLQTLTATNSRSAEAPEYLTRCLSAELTRRHAKYVRSIWQRSAWLLDLPDWGGDEPVVRRALEEKFRTEWERLSAIPGPQQPPPSSHDGLTSSGDAGEGETGSGDNQICTPAQQTPGNQGLQQPAGPATGSGSRNRNACQPDVETVAKRIEEIHVWEEPEQQAPVPGLEKTPDRTPARSPGMRREEEEGEHVVVPPGSCTSADGTACIGGDSSSRKPAPSDCIPSPQGVPTPHGAPQRHAQMESPAPQVPPGGLARQPRKRALLIGCSYKGNASVAENGATLQAATGDMLMLEKILRINYGYLKQDIKCDESLCMRLVVCVCVCVFCLGRNTHG